jgi:hypothetical protein
LRSCASAEVDVVVEAVALVFDGRALPELGVRIEALDRVGHDVRGRVAQHLEAFGALPGHDRDRGIRLDRLEEAAHLPVHLDPNRRLEQTLADRLRDLPARRAGGIFTLAAVGEGDLNHCVAHGWGLLGPASSEIEPED